LIIFDLDFTCLRILIVAGIVRLTAKREAIVINWNTFDKLIFVWAIVSAIIYCIQWADLRAAIYKSGRLFDIFGLYWLFRQTIRSWDDVAFAVKIFAICALLMVPLVLMEKATGTNPFRVLGRVGTAYREGKYRCQAAFPHSIIFGAFWATLVPLFLAAKIAGKNSGLYLTAIISSVVMVWASASSTPYGALGAGLVLFALFPVRHYGRIIAYSAIAGLAALHMVMKAPVWHLLARIDLVGGSTGWHRFNLIDQAIRHFGEWALLGTRSTAHWGYHLFDVTNEYCFQAVEGGLVSLILFAAILVAAVQALGWYSRAGLNREERWLAWGSCISLLVHCVAFISVAYFGQIHMLEYLVLSVAGLACGVRHPDKMLATDRLYR